MTKRVAVNDAGVAVLHGPVARSEGPVTVVAVNRGLDSAYVTDVEGALDLGADDLDADANTFRVDAGDTIEATLSRGEQLRAQCRAGEATTFHILVDDND